MADKGRWSIVNPSGEEVTFVTRDELRQAILDDEIEPHAESIPPELHSESVPVDHDHEHEGDRSSTNSGGEDARASRPTPRNTDPEVPKARTSKDAAAREGAAAGEYETGDELDSPPSLEGEMDEPTLQFTRPLSILPAAPPAPSTPPAASRHSPPEDEGSPLSLSDVGGEFAPASQSVDIIEAKMPRSDEDDGDRASAPSKEDAEDEDEKTLQDVDAASIDDDAIDDDDDGPDTPKPLKRMTPPPLLPSGDRRSSIPSLPSLPSKVPPRSSVMSTPRVEMPRSSVMSTPRVEMPRSSVTSASREPPPRSSVTSTSREPPPRSSVLSATRVDPSSSAVIINDRGTPTPRPSKAPERGRITATSLPPPDIIPDVDSMGRPSSPRLTDSGLYAPPEGHMSERLAPERHALPPAAAKPVAAAGTTKKKPSWIVPLALVGIGIAFWLGSRMSREPAPDASKTVVATPPALTTASPASATPEPETPPTPSAAVAPPPAEVESPVASSPPPAIPAPPETATATPPSVSAPTSAPVASADKPHPTPPPSVTTPATPTTTATAAAPHGDDAIGPQLRKAASVMRNGDYGTARQLYQTLLTKDPKNPEVLAGLGDTSRALGDKSGARSYYIRALDASSSFLPALLSLADTEWDLGERVGAQKHYAELLERQPNAPERARQRAKGLGGP